MSVLSDAWLARSVSVSSLKKIDSLFPGAELEASVAKHQVGEYPGV